jgi:uncharacterized Ntn-hydrolase superfamily protein/L-ascorbate metabolism protein UlaG (beta-lactamase superfamily)
MKHILKTLLLIVVVSPLQAGEISRAHYLANEGVMVTRGDTKILFDPLFRNGYGHYELVPDEMEQALFAGTPPWDGIDAVFVSHYHGDHFTPEIMLDFLRARPDIRFYGPAQAIDALRAIAEPADEALLDEVVAIDLEYQQAPIELVMDGLRIEAVRIPHAGWPDGRTEIENIVFRVTLDDDTTVVHMGDADANDIHFEHDAGYWDKRQTSMAFPPYWFFQSEDGRQILDERVHAATSVGIHVPEKMPDDPADRPAEFTGVDLFTSPGETREIVPSMSGKPLRPVHTYSIVARDEQTGQLGAAVQSHWFSVGSRVIWAEPGIGAVATQSFTDPGYGPKGLQLMRAGKTAAEALKPLLAADQHQDVRQVGMVDHNGNAANHTGTNSISEYCDIAGDGYTVQANLMWKPTVCAAMAQAFEQSNGDLAERMMVALEAAQGEGGDIRGKQSAAILVVSGDAEEPSWGGRVFDLRVEDQAEPLVELRRLIKMARAYLLMNEGDEHMTAGNTELAVAAYRGAEALVPDSNEMIFWHAATLAAAGHVDESLPLFSKAFRLWPLWRELVQRLPAAGLLPDDAELMEKILSVE